MSYKLPAVNRDLFKKAKHPRPDWQRDRWFSLDGEWEFREDRYKIGQFNSWHSASTFGKIIEVPFCAESMASGIGKTPANVIWYKTRFRLDPEFCRDRRVLLNFGAVDYETKVWLNGKLAGRHTGGFTSFRLDITDLVSKSENVLTVRVYDSKDPRIPRGKQTVIGRPFAIFYTTVTGIWQPVYIESAGRSYSESAVIDADPGTGEVSVSVKLGGDVKPDKLRLKVALPGAGEQAVTIDDISDGGVAETVFKVKDAIPWTLDRPQLYPMTIETLNQRGRVLDSVETYFGFRSVRTEGRKILLNGERLYQKLLLNQGYFPKGHFTPVDPGMFRTDVEIARRMGFNGFRIHQKIEDPRFLFWCDALGMLVWEEMPSAFLWSGKMKTELKAQWREAITRDRNHPSIITWVPLNESWGVNNLVYSGEVRKFIKELYEYTKELDPTRPVVDNSGFEHVKTDIFDLHHYLGTAEKARKYYETLHDPENLKFTNRNLVKRLKPDESAASPLAPGSEYEGQPMIISEYGGFGFYKTEDKSLLENYREYTLDIAGSDLFEGFCYTQFYDTEQEQNGLIDFNRNPKIELEEIQAVNREVDRLAADRMKQGEDKEA